MYNKDVWDGRVIIDMWDNYAITEGSLRNLGSSCGFPRSIDNKKGKEAAEKLIRERINDWFDLSNDRGV